jgi:DNA-binding NtrC family response regulator
LVCGSAPASDWNRTIAASLHAHDFGPDTCPEIIAENRLDRLPDLLKSTPPGLVFLSFPTSAWSEGIAAVPIFHDAGSSPPIIAVTDVESAEQLDSLFALGVVDYLSPPLRSADIVCRARRWLGLARNAPTAAAELREFLGLKGFVGQSPALLAELRKLPRFAPTDACVLILGETGTGKELCARAVHHLSRRSDGPFVALNTGAIPAELIENELFGHDAGAYTSARGPQRGLIAEAEGGTLFLDEIDTLPLAAQVKLLRFLQEKEYRPLGARRGLSANVRVIAASNLNLAVAVATGRFRKDLYYRINVLPLTLPPLSRRGEDIPLLAQHFVAKHAGGRPRPGLAPDALAKLQRYDWPGNVRELENVIERALALSEDWLIAARDIDLPVPDASEDAAAPEPFRGAKARVVSRFESDYLRDMLLRHAGNISHAARAAGKNRRAFFALMKKHKITLRATAAVEPRTPSPCS